MKPMDRQFVRECQRATCHLETIRNLITYKRGLDAISTAVFVPLLTELSDCMSGLQSIIKDSLDQMDESSRGG